MISTAIPSAFLTLLVAIVVMGTKALPIGAVPEQAIITLVRDDVVKVDRRFIASWVIAARMRGKVGGAGFVPSAVISTLARCWAALIGMPLADGLAGATLTGWDDVAATAKAGRCNRH